MLLTSTEKFQKRMRRIWLGGAILILLAIGVAAASSLLVDDQETEDCGANAHVCSSSI